MFRTRLRGWGRTVAVVVTLVMVAAAAAAVPGPNSPVAEAQQNQLFVQLGQDLDGDAKNDRFGTYVAMSSDGNTVAIAARAADGVGDVRVFGFSGIAWEQRGRDIAGLHRGKFAQTTVAISGDGDTVVVGSYLAQGQRGVVQILDWTGGDWVLRGDIIAGAQPQDHLGRSLAISADGNTVVAGGGADRIFGWDGSRWVQRGSDLEIGGVTGDSAAISDDGNTVVFGSSDNAALTRVAVRALFWDGNDWAPLGNDILPVRPDSRRFGSSVAISADGNTIVTGDSELAASVYVYDWNGSRWIQRGQAVTDPEPLSRFGDAVAISDDGNTIAASKGSDQDAWILDWNGSRWVRRAGLQAEDPRDVSRGAIALSADGNTAIMGAPLNRENGAEAGSARVFRAVPCEGPLCDPSLPFEDGEVVFLNNLGSGRYLDGDGVQRAWNVDTSPDARWDAGWRLVDNGDDTWSLLNRRRTRYLDADGPRQGWNVGQSTRIKDDDRWVIALLDGDNAYTLRNVATNRYLHQASNNNVVVVQESDIDENTSWQIAPAR